MSYNYYLDQLKRLNIEGEVQVKFYSSTCDSNFLNMNTDTLKAINVYFSKYNNILTKEKAIENLKDYVSLVINIHKDDIHLQETRKYIQSITVAYTNALAAARIIDWDTANEVIKKSLNFIYYSK